MIAVRVPVDVWGDADGEALLDHWLVSEGALVQAGRLDQLFLTLSPVLAGRRAGDGRLGLLEGVELLPAAGRWARQTSRSLRMVSSSASRRSGARVSSAPDRAAAGTRVLARSTPCVPSCCRSLGG